METWKIRLVTSVFLIVCYCYFEVHSAIKEHTSIGYNCVFLSVQGIMIFFLKKGNKYHSAYNMIGEKQLDIWNWSWLSVDSCGKILNKSSTGYQKKEANNFQKGGVLWEGLSVIRRIQVGDIKVKQLYELSHRTRMRMK